jgi:hypothetical protein
MEEKYTHVIIIGNGFDLNQGLKTSYSDFIKSKEFLSILDNNSLANYLNEKHELKNWIDIENELKEYSKLFDDSDECQTDFVSMTKALKDYLLNIPDQKIDISKPSYKLIKLLKDTKFLIIDFNYTKTTKNILKEIGISDEEIEQRLIKVHNSIDDDEIIFGVEDSARIKQDHVFLRKAFYKSYKAIKVNKLLENISELIIFGYSLGETDHMYFEQFFRDCSRVMSNDPKNLVLFYHGDEGYKQLFMQIDALTMNNLSRLRQNNKLDIIDTKK